MAKARASFVPPRPNNFADFANYLRTYHPMNGFFREAKQAADGSWAIVFMTETMRKALQRASELSGDGTFEVIAIIICALLKIVCPEVLSKLKLQSKLIVSTLYSLKTYRGSL